MTNPYFASHFHVTWGETQLLCSEIKGLSVNTQVTGYREDLSPEPYTKKIPGLIKYDNITLKHCVFSNDDEYFTWLNTFKKYELDCHDMVVKRLNEDHEHVMTWKIQKACPSKDSVMSTKVSDNKIYIETLKIVHEGIFIIESR